jgi:hypothetical protein
MLAPCTADTPGRRGAPHPAVKQQSVCYAVPLSNVEHYSVDYQEFRIHTILAVLL